MQDVATAEHHWYHVIDLPDGSTTPGRADVRAARPYVEWPDQVKGGRCLDVGTFDGFWAFEMERLGASEVVGYDIDDPALLDWAYDWRDNGIEAARAAGTLDGVGFRTAAAALGSSAKRVCGTIYALDPDVHGTFDVVSCGALILHLRDPIRALEAMRSVCRGELVLIESLDALLDMIARRVPCARFAPEGDKWWRANTAGMASMLDRAGFEVVSIGPRFLVPYGEGALLRDSIAAGKLRQRGGLHRAFRARPRPPKG